jgi:hypothetical protein
MVDTRDLKSLISYDVGVRAPSWAPNIPPYGDLFFALNYDNYIDHVC